MLTSKQKAEIKRLLAEKASFREIATLTGASRGAVAAFARRKQRRGRKPAPRRTELEELGPFERCPGCGRRVSMPCRACQADAIRDRRQPTADARMRASHGPLKIRLRGSRRARYERVRKRRLASEAREGIVASAEYLEREEPGALGVPDGTPGVPDTFS